METSIIDRKVVTLVKEINGKMLIGIGATVAIGCTCMLYYLLTYDYLTIRSPYVGYELGYQQANIGPEALLSPQMRDRTKATIESELKTNTEKYTYDEETQIAKTVDMDYLYNGRYELSAVLGSQSDRMMMSVHDSYAPVFLNLYPEIVIEENALKEKAELVEYFNIQDYDTGAEIAILADKIDIKKAGSYTIRAMGYDTSGNFTEVEVPVRIITSKEAQLRPEILTVNRQGIVPATEATRKKLGDKYLRFDPAMLNFGTDLKNGVVYDNENDYTNKIKDLQETKAKLNEEEKQFIQDLCKEGYESTQDEEAKRKIEEQRNTEQLQDTKKVQEGIDRRKEQIEEFRKQEEEEAKKKEEENQKEVEDTTTQVDNAQAEYNKNPTPENKDNLEQANREAEEARKRQEALERERAERERLEAERRAKEQAEKQARIDNVNTKITTAKEQTARVSTKVSENKNEIQNKSTSAKKQNTESVATITDSYVLPYNENKQNQITYLNNKINKTMTSHKNMLASTQQYIEDLESEKEEIIQGYDSSIEEKTKKIKEIETTLNNLVDKTEDDKQVVELTKEIATIDGEIETLKQEAMSQIESKNTVINQQVDYIDTIAVNVLSDRYKIDQDKAVMEQLSTEYSHTLCLDRNLVANGKLNYDLNTTNGFYIAERLRKGFVDDDISDSLSGKDFWSKETDDWDDVGKESYKNNQNYLSIGQVFGGLGTEYFERVCHTNKNTEIRGAQGKYLSFSTLEEAQRAQAVLKDVSKEFFREATKGTQGYALGDTDVTIRYIEADSAYDYPQVFASSQTPWRNWEGAPTIPAPYNKADLNANRIKRDMVAYYRPSVGVNEICMESTYQTGWYIKLQGIYVTSKPNHL